MIRRCGAWALLMILGVACQRPVAAPTPRPTETRLVFDGKPFAGTLSSTRGSGDPQVTLRLNLPDVHAASPAFGVPPGSGTLVPGEVLSCIEVRVLARTAGRVDVMTYPASDMPPLWTSHPRWCPHAGGHFAWTFTIGGIEAALEKTGTFPNAMHLANRDRTRPHELAVMLLRLPRREDSLREDESTLRLRTIASSQWVSLNP